MPARRPAVRRPVRGAPGARGRRGLGGRPGRRAVVRVLLAVVPVLRPARAGQGRPPCPSRPTAAARARLPAAAAVLHQKRRRTSGDRLSGVLRAVRAPVHAVQGKRHIRHGRVHRIRTHAEAKVHQEVEQGEWQTK